MSRAIYPDALVIGPMRTATTWIYQYLSLRDDVCLPGGVKETFFFDRRYERGMSWYAAHFRHCSRQAKRRVVEVAPSYFHSDVAPKRVRSCLGVVRLIVVVRDPVERAISHYHYLRSRGLVGTSLTDAIRQFPEIIDASHYYRHLRRWEAIFGEANVSLLWYEDLKMDHMKFVKDLCNSLEIPCYPVEVDLGKTKVNTPSEPWWPWLARAGRWMANWLRNYRIYTPIEVAKRLGMEKIFFGSQGRRRKIEISLADKEFLRQLVAADWELFQKEFASRDVLPTRRQG